MSTCWTLSSGTRVQFFRNRDIDRQLWDQCINASTQCRVYALSWFLDSVAVDWDAYILLKDGAYQAVFPLPKTNLLFIYLIRQPLFTQQLGLFSAPASDEKSLLASVLKALDGYSNYYLLSINSENSQHLSKEMTQADLREMRNLELDLSLPIDQLRAAYTPLQRSNLKKAKKHGVMAEGFDDPILAVDIFRETSGRNLTDLGNKEYHLLTYLLRKSMEIGIGKGLLARDSEGNVVAVVFYLLHRGRVYNILNASASKKLPYNAVTFLLDQIFEKYAEKKGHVFDFEGSNLPNIFKYFAEFGAVENNYRTLRKNKLAFPLNTLIK